MRITLLGAKGMLGHDLTGACNAAGIEVSGFDLPEVDITKDDGGLQRLPAGDWVVNCAAYTDVDGAESHREVCFAVNADGPGRVATSWVDARPIPSADSWFETVWNDYLKDRIVR